MTERVSTSTLRNIPHNVPVNLFLCWFWNIISHKHILGSFYQGYPHLTRLVVAYGDEAEALCVYLKTLNVKHLAVFLYDTRVDNRDLYKNLIQIAPSYDIVVYPFEFGINPRNETYLLDDAIEDLKESGINYIIGYLHDDEMIGYVDMNRVVLDKLVNEGLLGNPDYFWIFQTDFLYQFDESDQIGVFQPMDERLATAINNTAILTVEGLYGTTENTQLDESVLQLVHDAEFWPYFDSIRQEREMDAARSIPFSVDPLDYWISTMWYV
jgi:hypothetical protein